MEKQIGMAFGFRKPVIAVKKKTGQIDSYKIHFEPSFNIYTKDWAMTLISRHQRRFWRTTIGPL